ncbi:MAG: hypothetical protein LBT46_13535 [Planctomycetaceae bacterium]|jgi:hypothetical protein|nr:hypothetical protein [Planctomycetaceae bacterium]
MPIPKCLASSILPAQTNSRQCQGRAFFGVLAKQNTEVFNFAAAQNVQIVKPEFVFDLNNGYGNAYRFCGTHRYLVLPNVRLFIIPSLSLLTQERNGANLPLTSITNQFLSGHTDEKTLDSFRQ